MPREVYVFLDFDDTLSDLSQHGPLYVSELAALLASDYGHAAQEWAAALAPALGESKARYEARFRGEPLAGYSEWIEAERGRLAEAVFAQVGAELPSNEAPAAVAKRLQFDALVCCNAAYPGAETALRTLFERGYRLSMASSQESDFLIAALMGARLESFFENRFGPDLVDCAKEGVDFYTRIFEACPVEPKSALVVDDQPDCLAWAAAAGAQVVQARLKPDSPPQAADHVITNLLELPDLIERLGRKA